jgi:hypothetical protein
MSFAYKEKDVGLKQDQPSVRNKVQPSRGRLLRKELK